jgi:inosine-uridine nucleoside N-ribohydrolase
MLSPLFKPVLLLAALVGCLPTQTILRADDASPGPANIIFDTDMSGDVDDVGALAVLNKLTNLGEAKMLACVTNNDVPEKAIGGCIKAINTYYGNPDVPIGTYHGKKYANMASPYDGKVRDEFAKTEPPDDQLPTSLEIYRKTLAAAPDGSVTVVSVGFLVNLRELLESPADAASPLTGKDLVKQKVKKLVVMGGAYPSGNEWNFSGDNAGPDTQYVVENWPTPILFSGFEIGQGITTGIKIQTTPATNPARRAYELYNKFSGRSSWDPTAVLAAVRDPKLYWDIKADGYNKVNDNGSNAWSPTPNRGHSYLVTRVPQAEVGAVLDNLMTLPPGPAK